MNRNPITLSMLTTVAVLAAFLGAGSANAATVTYVGHQDDVEAAADTPTTGWRNATPAKPLDIDGDNILGTDGYSIFQANGNSISSLPTYISSVQRIGGNSNSAGSFGVMDNPADPSGADTINFGIWHAGASNTNASNIFRFTVAGTDLNGQTLRVGIMYDTFNVSGSQTLTLTQTVGGSATASSPLLTFADTGMDVAFFDITNAIAGDVFTLIADATDGGGGSHAGGITFDTFDTTAVPESGSLALLVLGGLCLLGFRRRR